MSMRISRLPLTGLLVLSVLASGCATRSPGLYGWGSYQAQVYEHFKASSTNPEDQILVLEEDLEKFRSKNVTPAPGFHAHLGMLYTSVGRDDKAFQAFEAEKTLFPESAQYIDFLIKKAKPEPKPPIKPATKPSNKVK